MNFIGGSYDIELGKVSKQRAINLYPKPIEKPDKAKAILESIPGYRVFASPGAAIRGCFTTNDRTFFVAGSGLYEYTSAGTSTLLGSLNSFTGPVDMDYGVTQLVIVDGDNGYVLTLATNNFVRITAAGFYGSSRVAFLDNYFLFVRPDSGQFYISALNDATSDDPSDFATAESQPDNLVVPIPVQRRLILIGTLSTEIWFDSGNADFPFEREGTTIEIGCVAAHSARVLDNTVFWVGRDKNGVGIVYRLDGYQAVRVSDEATERALQQSSDLTQATAYAYQQYGLLFYAINAPGMDTTRVYEVKSGLWHERADLDVQGNFAPDRAVCHTFAFGKNLVGGSDGVIYELDRDYYQKGTDPLVRKRIGSHTNSPTLDNTFYSRLILDCETGESLNNTDTFVELKWFDWKGNESRWSEPVQRSIGKIGERFPRVKFHRLGYSKDRVWDVTYAGNGPYSLVNLIVQ